MKFVGILQTFDILLEKWTISLSSAMGKMLLLWGKAGNHLHKGILIRLVIYPPLFAGFLHILYFAYHLFPANTAAVDTKMTSSSSAQENPARHSANIYLSTSGHTPSQQLNVICYNILQVICFTTISDFFPVIRLKWGFYLTPSNYMLRRKFGNYFINFIHRQLWELFSVPNSEFLNATK